jgi:hypothetical protein
MKALTRLCRGGQEASPPAPAITDSNPNTATGPNEPEIEDVLSDILPMPALPQNVSFETIGRK